VALICQFYQFAACYSFGKLIYYLLNPVGFSLDLSCQNHLFQNYGKKLWENIMTDKEKQACNCGENHDHDCDDDCDCESNTITLDMEDGTQKDFTILNILEYNGSQYVALAEEDSEEYDILRFIEVEDSLELSIIEDDAEYNAVAEKFDDLFSSEFEDMELMEEE